MALNGGEPGRIGEPAMKAAYTLTMTQYTNHCDRLDASPVHGGITVSNTAGPRFDASDDYPSTIASTRRGLPLPPTSLSDAAITMEPVGGRPAFGGEAIPLDRVGPTGLAMTSAQQPSIRDGR